ncbi:MAG: protein kinase [Myxococcales bacterium]|nr:protein kinase [Myxococcales bacterium]
MIEAGTVIGGRYRLLEELGEGGMAIVWTAEHLTLSVKVAVKFMTVAGPNIAELTERFMLEARAAASIRHRNVVEIMDFGLHDGRVPYMVMELLIGESLADRLERDGHLEVSEAIHIVSLTLRGLAAVHDRGIVHRDLKPENIFLLDDKEGVFPKLIDFGVSREAGRTNLTQQGALLGTPDYMSPEQARGRKGIDAGTDLYSMGVILFELITGRLPFESEHLGDLIVMITSQPAPRVEDFCPDIPTALGDVIDRALAKDRAERFETAEQMRDALLEAGESYGFGSGASQLFRLSELPPSNPDLEPLAPGAPRRTPSAGSRRRGSGEDVAPRRQSAATPNRRSLADRGGPAAGMAATMPATPADLAAEAEAEARGGRAPAPSGEIALGSLPPLPGPSGDASGAPEGSGRRGFWMAQLLVLLLAAIGGAAAFYYFGDAVKPPDAEIPPIWEPSTIEFSPELLDAGAPPAARIHLSVLGVPEGAWVQVQGVPLSGRSADLPMLSGEYRIEVVDPQLGVRFRVEHPGDVDGEYEYFPMGADDLDLPEAPDDAGIGDAGIGDAGAEGDAGPERRRRPRRRPRIRRLPRRIP